MSENLQKDNPVAPEGVHRFETEESGVDPSLASRLSDAIESKTEDDVRACVSDVHNADLADLIGLLPRSQRHRLLRILRVDLDPDLLLELDVSIRLELADVLSPKEMAEAITEMESDEAVQVLEDLEKDELSDVLREVSAEDREEIELGLHYPEDTAGRRMQVEVVTVATDWSVGQTIDYLRTEADLPDEFFDVFVLDDARRPAGVISLSRILRSPRSTAMSEIVDETQVIVPADMEQEEVALQFEKYDLTTAGVVDDDGKLLGMITVDDVMEVAREEFEEDVLHLGGVGEEAISDSVLTASRKRFAWLLVNLGTAISASLVIYLFKGTLEHMVALAVLMPIVASMGGNAGTQTLTITVRALATKELTPFNSLRAVRKELVVCTLNGCLFALLAGFGATYWFDDLVLGGVIGGAMVINMMVAGVSGAFLPIFFERIGIDPAVASGVFVTTVTDVVGFFAFLGLATLVFL
ncbi:MAG: magnesium transporter [Opitutae bacterium]|nr:magnesium transporter [Opitutae bacterium]